MSKDEPRSQAQQAAIKANSRAAMERRKQVLDWFAANTVRSETSSAELIREDRDSR